MSGAPARGFATILENFNIHKLLFCNIDTCFGPILRNSVSQGLKEHAFLALGLGLYHGQVGAEIPLYWGNHFPLQVLNRSWDTEGKSRGETMSLADLPGRHFQQPPRSKFRALGGGHVCPPALCVIVQVFFRQKQFAYPTVLIFLPLPLRDYFSRGK